MTPTLERAEYGKGSLSREDLVFNPIEQLRIWWQDAIKADIRPIDAAHLSTVDTEGNANGRIILLKHFDDQGLVFFTNYQSEKSKELLQNQSAALTIFWPLLERQVRVRGFVKKTTREESETYWSSRPRGAQLAGWASEQSRRISSRDQLLKSYGAMEQRFNNQEIPCPSFWGGFRITPFAFEFWQGRYNRLHDRFAYRKEGEMWHIDRLAP